MISTANDLGLTNRTCQGTTNIRRREVWFLPFVEGQERRCLRGDFTLCVIRERGRHDGGGSMRR